jgi:hypothetical protein
MVEVAPILASERAHSALERRSEMEGRAREDNDARESASICVGALSRWLHNNTRRFWIPIDGFSHYSAEESQSGGGFPDQEDRFQGGPGLPPSAAIASS